MYEHVAKKIDTGTYYNTIRYGTLFVIWAINFDGSLINMPAMVQHTEITLNSLSQRVQCTTLPAS